MSIFRLGWASQQAAKEPGTVVFEGFINDAGDFPLVDNRDIGDMYHINNDVTDPYPPGQSFLAGQNIKWLGSLWTISDSEQIWKDDTSTISKINSTRDVDVSNGSLIADIIKAKDSNGLKFYNSSSQSLLTFDNTTKLATFENSAQINGSLTIDEQTTDSKVVINDSVGGSFPSMNFFSKTGDFGVGAVLNAIPGSPTTNSTFQINKGVTTSGNVRTQFYRANGVPTDINCTIGGNQDSWFNYLAGNVGIGTDTPLEKLHVAGNARQNGAVTVSDATSINDEAEISLTAFGDTVSCYGEIFIKGSPSAIATFTRDTDNSITLISATAGIFNTTDTDGYFVIYNSTNILTLKNRLGSSKDIIYRVHK